MKTEEKIWTVLIVYGLVAFTLVMMLISCKTSQSCHSKKVYVSKSIRKAQNKPNAH
jgi:hypothetical protein